MKRNFFIALMLGASLMACSKQYYPQMYEKAGEDEMENVFIDSAVQEDAKQEEVKQEEIKQAEEVKQVVDTVKTEAEVEKSEKIVESSDKYTTEDGADVVYAYHVVVGSFSSRTNASNLSIELNKSGVKATVARNQNGLYRVFYYSTDNEPEVRQVLAKARKKYPDAWMLKLVAR
jgi:cell division septation protein DedD